jgi:hypothetical protein
LEIGMDEIRGGEPTTSSEELDALREELFQAQEEARHLQTALDSRIVIEQAKGVLRERFAWSVDEAFEVLRYAARGARTNLHALATEVVRNAQTPNAVIVAIARSARWRSAHMREHAELQRARAAELEAAVRAQQERLAWRQKELNEGRPPRPKGEH